MQYPSQYEAAKGPDERKPYVSPRLEKLGGLIADTLPGGSKGTEGGSGKGRST